MGPWLRGHWRLVRLHLGRIQQTVSDLIAPIRLVDEEVRGRNIKYLKNQIFV